MVPMTHTEFRNDTPMYLQNMAFFATKFKMVDAQNG